MHFQANFAYIDKVELTLFILLSLSHVSLTYVSLFILISDLKNPPSKTVYQKDKLSY